MSSPIPIYGVLVFFGFIAAISFAYIEWRKKGYSTFKFSILLGWGGFWSLMGARWWYLAFNPADYEGFYSLFDVSSGRSIMGSMFFGTLSIYFFTKWWMPELEFRRAYSIIVPYMLIGQAIGRWGNFYNQEIYGQAVDSLAFLPQFIQEGMYIDGVYYQPLFLYEFIGLLFAFFIITCLMKPNKWFKPGTHGSMYFLLYGVIRASMELSRAPEFIMQINGFPTSFLLAILFVVYGVISFIYYQWYYEKNFAKWYEFELPLFYQQFKSNFIALGKLVIFQTSIKEYKKSRTENIQVRKDKISKLDHEEVRIYMTKISQRY